MDQLSENLHSLNCDKYYIHVIRALFYKELSQTRVLILVSGNLKMKTYHGALQVSELGFCCLLILIYYYSLLLFKINNRLLILLLIANYQFDYYPISL